MKSNIKKLLAALLSFSLLMGCFNIIPSVANATDGEATPAAEESDVFTFADFEDGTSPFRYNGKAGASEGQFYTYDGNTALLLNNGANNNLEQRLPDTVLTGERMSMDAAKSGIQGYAYTVGNEGYRPTKVVFQFKPVGRASNVHILFEPLTFSGTNSSNPLASVLSLNMIIQAANGRVAWTNSYTGIQTPSASTAESVTVFKELSDAVRDTKFFTFASTTMDTTGTEEGKQKNVELIESIKWYTMEVNYTWDDANSKVMIDAEIMDGATSLHNKYTVAYDPAHIEKVYNFGMIAVADQNPILIDNFAYYSENLETHKVVGPHTSFLNAHQEVIETADGFDITADYASKSSDEKTALKNAIDAFLSDYAKQSDLVRNYVDVQTAYDNVCAMKEEILSYSASSVLEDYITTYADVLGLVADDLTVKPSELTADGLAERLAAAVAAFHEIDEELRSSAEGVAIGAKLSRLDQCLGYQASATGDGIYTQNFEGSNDFGSYAEYEGLEETNIGTVTDFQKNGVIAADTGNSTAYKIQTVVESGFDGSKKPDGSEKEKYGQFVTADKMLYDVMANNGRYLSSGSFDMYLLPFYNAVKEQMIVYGFTDTANYQFFGMFGQKNSKAPSAISVSMRDYKVTDLYTASASEEVDGKTYQRRDFGFYSEEDFANKWYHFEFMYDSANKFHLVISNENGRIWSYDSQRVETVALADRILAFGMMGQNTGYYVDNVTLRFTNNGQDAEIDERTAFCSSQSVRETTELVTGKIVPYDFARIEKFIADYEALSETNQKILSKMTDRIDAFRIQMALWDTTSDSKVADSFIAIYGDKLTETTTFGIFNRLTKAQRNLIKRNYAEAYQTMLGAVLTSGEDSVIDITCVGDSLTYGSGSTAPATDSYPAQLAAKLGDGYATYNHGVPGIKVLMSSSVTDVASTNGQFRSTDSYYNSLVTKPDIVVIMLGTNDHVVDSKLFEISDAKRAQIKAGYTDLIQSYLALDCNPTVILATIPVTNYAEGDARNRDKVSYYKRLELDKIYKEVAEEYDLPLVDVSNITGQWTDEERNAYFNSDCLHLNKTGYGILANAFAEFITARQWSNMANGCVLNSGSLKFETVQPEITDSVSLTYKASVGSLDEGVVPFMTFAMNGVVSEPVEGKLVEGTTDVYSFKYTNIMVHNMADKITATLSAGSETAVYEYSVMDYCQKVLGMENVEGYSSEQLAALKTMIVDLVAYGAATQKYRNPSIAEDALLTGMLTSEQLALGTATEKDLTSLEGVVTQKLTGDASETFRWTGVTLVLKDKTNIRCRFTAKDISNLTIKIMDGDTVLATKNSSDFTSISGETYYVDFDNIYAYEYGKTFKFVFCNDGTEEGQALNYSVNTYLNAKAGSTITNLVPLLKTIAHFGDSAVKFVGLSKAQTAL